MPRPIPTAPSRVTLARLIAVAALAAGLASGTVEAAGPRDEVRSAFTSAKNQFNDLDLDAAMATLDGAVARAAGAGLANDPSLAPVHALRGGIIFSNSGNRAQALAAFKQAVQADYNVTLPIELRSPELQKLLEEARRSVQRPGNDPIVHTPPAFANGADLEFVAQANVQLPDNAQMVLYWRAAGSSGEFNGELMDLFGNVGSFNLSAARHANNSIEYFFYAFDANNKQLVNRGDKERPLKVSPTGETVGGGGGTSPKGPGGEEDEKPPGDTGRKKPHTGKTKMPRVFLNFGVGTGAGIARGSAELTYQQFTPGAGSTTYNAREQACAIERWYAGNGRIAGDQLQFQQNITDVTAIPGVLPLGTTVQSLSAAYDPGYCGQHHPVTTGFASAPLHIAPEVGVRVARNFVIAAYARLQVVSGSKVFTEDPVAKPNESFALDVRSGNPSGFRRKPPFSWGVGVKFKYFFLPEDRKFRLFAGGFAGYGSARLRVNMGFSNDRNGNSVPDAIESPFSGPINPANNKIDVANCVAVWPYNGSCQLGTAGETDQNLARSVALNTKATDTRIDTVKIGPGFVGALFGFHYQIIKHFGLYGEIDIGAWFPSTTSALFDLTIGPSVTF